MIFIPGLSPNVWWVLAVVFFTLVISSWMISKDKFLETLKGI